MTEPHVQRRTELPAPASIYKLGHESRHQALPTKYRRIVRPQKGRARTFVGRKYELSQMRWLLRNSPVDPKRVDEESDAFAVLITAPPGAGKTTLIQRFAELEGEKGRPCFLLEHAAAHSKAAFVSALTQTRIWRQARILHHAKVNGVNLAQAIRDRNIPEVIETVADGLRRSRWVNRYKKLDKVLSALGGREVQTFDEALRALEFACPKGYTIAFDEVQEWRTQPDNEEMKSLLQTIADPAIRDAAGRHGGGVLLAGLSDSYAAVRERGLSRIEPIWLKSLSEDEIKELVIREIESSEADETIVASVKQRWADVLGRDFHQWTHHGDAAAYAARRVLNQYAKDLRKGRKVPDSMDTLLDRVRTLAGNRAKILYDITLNNNAESMTPPALQVLAAVALQTNNKIPSDVIDPIISLAEERLRKERRPLLSGEEIMRIALHTGLLERDREGNTLLNGYRMPIGCLPTYISDVHEEYMEFAHEEARNILGLIDRG